MMSRPHSGSPGSFAVLKTNEKEAMKDKNTEQSSSLSARMVEDDATERLKKRAQDLGLIVNAGAGKESPPTGEKKVRK